MRIIIQAVNGKTAAMAFAETSVDAAPGGSYLFIAGAGADRMVRSLNLLQVGRSLAEKATRMLHCFDQLARNLLVKYLR
jgi:hypothetical protein